MAYPFHFGGSFFSSMHTLMASVMHISTTPRQIILLLYISVPFQPYFHQIGRHLGTHLGRHLGRHLGHLPIHGFGVHQDQGQDWAGHKANLFFALGRQGHLHYFFEFVYFLFFYFFGGLLALFVGFLDFFLDF